jgi:Resolvase, N terminal domain
MLRDRRASCAQRRPPNARSGRMKFARHRTSTGPRRRPNPGGLADGGSLGAAIYARVSNTDQHTIPEQVRQLEQYAERRGWKVVRSLREIASGAAAARRATSSSRDAAARAADAFARTIATTWSAHAEKGWRYRSLRGLESRARAPARQQARYDLNTAHRERRGAPLPSRTQPGAPRRRGARARSETRRGAHRRWGSPCSRTGGSLPWGPLDPRSCSTRGRHAAGSRSFPPKTSAAP